MKSAARAVASAAKCSPSADTPFQFIINQVALLCLGLSSGLGSGFGQGCGLALGSAGRLQTVPRLNTCITRASRERAPVAGYVVAVLERTHLAQDVRVNAKNALNAKSQLPPVRARTCLQL